MILPNEVVLAVGEYYIRRNAKRHHSVLQTLSSIPGVNITLGKEPVFDKEQALEKISEACGENVGYTAFAGYFFFSFGEEREEMSEASWPNFVSPENRIKKRLDDENPC